MSYRANRYLLGCDVFDQENSDHLRAPAILRILGNQDSPRVNIAGRDIRAGLIHWGEKPDHLTFNPGQKPHLPFVAPAEGLVLNASQNSCHCRKSPFTRVVDITR